MTFQSNGKRWKKIFRNAALLGGITMVSNLTAAGGFSWAAIWAAFLAACLIALVEIKYAYKILPSVKPNHKHQSSFFLS